MMKQIKKRGSVGLMALALALLCGCSSAATEPSPEAFLSYDGAQAPTLLPDRMEPSTAINEEEPIAENPFVSTETNPISTFSADVDTASYAYFRKLVNSGYSAAAIKTYAANALRIEEMVNYFSYDYPQPAQGEVFAAGGTVAVCPWNTEHLLLTLQVAAQEIIEPKANNLVFLIDVSGSMAAEDKLPLLQKAFAYLTEQLTEQDTVSIVTYSGKEEVVLRGCPGNDTARILSAVNGLTARGSTNGEAGMTMAYSIAADYYIEGGNNRILMASDGDLNVGLSSAEDLKTYVETKRESGIYLSTLGFGTGNYQDPAMETLADNGNGVYYYIDSETEAHKVFGSEMLATLETVAENVKFQLTFSPQTVSAYRLIGYENRILSTEDFEDDRKDAGEVGSGHTLTVAYEIVLAENVTPNLGEGKGFASLAMRYCRPGQTESELRTYEVGAQAYTETPNEDFRFAVAVMETAMILRGSRYCTNITLPDVLEEVSALSLTDEYRAEFVSLLRTLIHRGEN